MSLFSKKKKVSAKKFGNMLGEVLREALAEYSREENLSNTKKEFMERRWNYNNQRYSLELLKMFINIIHFTISNDYSHLSNSEQITIQFHNTYADLLPKEHALEIFKTQTDLLSSGQPLLTISRISAQNYFRQENADIEKIIYFAASAKAFNKVIESLKKEVKVK